MKKYTLFSLMFLTACGANYKSPTAPVTSGCDITKTVITTLDDGTPVVLTLTAHYAVCPDTTGNK
jgi:hypothetical protein